MEKRKTKHIHLPLTDTEFSAIEKYCDENGIIFGQLVRRLVVKEIQSKSTLLSPDFVPPKVTECLIEKARK